MGWVKCPRCLLNYINEDTDQFCKVCLVDMGKIAGSPELELDEEDYRLCPECGENYLEEGEERCYACRLERMKLESKEALALDADDVLEVYEDLSADVPHEVEEVLVEDVEVLKEAEEDDVEEEEEI